MWRVLEIIFTQLYYCEKTMMECNTDRGTFNARILLKTPSIQPTNCSCSQGIHLTVNAAAAIPHKAPHTLSLTMVFLLLFSSHSFFSCGPSDKSSKERGMFDGLLDSRRPENTSPGEAPTLSLICHPMQVGFLVWLFIIFKQKVVQHPDFWPL